MTQPEGTRAWLLCVYDLNHKSTIHAIDLTHIEYYNSLKLCFFPFKFFVRSVFKALSYICGRPIKMSISVRPSVRPSN
jgi:hypothetical protein